MTYTQMTELADAQSPGLADYPGLGLWKAELDADIRVLNGRYGHETDADGDTLPLPDEYARMYALYYRVRYEQATGDYDAANAFAADFENVYNEYHVWLARKYQPPPTRYSSTL